jgi:hypothetical protein
VRAALAGILTGLTAAYPTLALLLWHATAWTLTTTAAGAGWVVQQPAGAAAVTVLLGWRYLTRRGRRRTA